MKVSIQTSMCSVFILTLLTPFKAKPNFHWGIPPSPFPPVLLDCGKKSERAISIFTSSAVDEILELSSGLFHVENWKNVQGRIRGTSNDTDGKAEHLEFEVSADFYLF